MLVTSAQQLSPNTFENPLEFNPWRWKVVFHFHFQNAIVLFRFCFFFFLRGVNLKTLSKLIMLRHRIGNQELKSHVVSKNFMPFGGGMRQCAGAEYSRVFLATFFHVLLTKYRYIFCLHSSHFKRLKMSYSLI